MSNFQQSRILAYSLAKEIPHAQLAGISGAKSGVTLILQQTMQPSHHLGSIDISIDQVMDE